MNDSIMRFCSVILVFTWVLCAVSWFLWHDVPYELLSLVTWLFCAALGLCICKDCVASYCNRKQVTAK